MSIDIYLTYGYYMVIRIFKLSHMEYITSVLIFCLYTLELSVCGSPEIEYFNRIQLKKCADIHQMGGLS